MSYDEWENLLSIMNRSIRHDIHGPLDMILKEMADTIGSVDDEKRQQLATHVKQITQRARLALAAFEQLSGLILDGQFQQPRKRPSLHELLRAGVKDYKVTLRDHETGGWQGAELTVRSAVGLIIAIRGACSNAVRHGSQATGPVEVCVGVVQAHFQIDIVNPGRLPSGFSPSIWIEENPERGLAIIQMAAERFFGGEFRLEEAQGRVRAVIRRQLIDILPSAQGGSR